MSRKFTFVSKFHSSVRTCYDCIHNHLLHSSPGKSCRWSSMGSSSWERLWSSFNIVANPKSHERSDLGYRISCVLFHFQRYRSRNIFPVHHNGIIHRDIKPFNIIYTKDRRTVKLIDFGIAHYIPSASLPASSNEPSSSTSNSHSKGKERARAEVPSIDASLFPTSDLFKRLGTPAFLAPEIVWFQDDTPADRLPQSTVNPRRRVFTMPKTRPPITYAIDIWSLGVTFYGLLFGRLPFDVPADAFQNAYNSEYTIYNLICTADWEANNYMSAENMPTGGRHPEDPKREGAQIIHLLDRMLQKNPVERITVAEIKVFMRNVLQQNISQKIIFRRTLGSSKISQILKSGCS